MNLIIQLKGRGAWLVAGLLISLSVSSCRIGNKAERFDPIIPEVGTDDGLVFHGVEVERKLPADALIPSLGPVRVGPGDKLDIEIVETPNTRATVIVMPDGMLHYDMAGGIQVKGLTLPELERKLSERLQEHYGFPIVTINLTSAQSSSYTVLGQVKKPGTYTIGQPTRLLEAIALAGGFLSSELGGKTQDIADLKRSIIVRDNKVVPIDFETAVKEGDPAQNVFIRPGDYIFLPAEGDEKVFVLGAVNRPTGIPYSSRVTLLTALAAAKGPKPNAYTLRSILLRGSAKEPRAAVVNVNAAYKGRAPDFPLEPGDILWVPKAPWNKLEEYAKVAVESAATSIALQQSFDHFSNENESLNVTQQIDVTPEPDVVIEPEPDPVVVPVPDPVPDPIVATP